MSDVTVQLADFSNRQDRQALQDLMQEYATDPMGGGEPLSQIVLQTLADKLLAYPGAFSVIAWRGDTPLGLINTFETLSTFKAKPLINIHDVIVTRDCRGMGLAHKMLVAVEQRAREKGCCKLTLEVLEGNERARHVYREFGFSGYELDERFGKAMFWEKPLL